MEKVNVRTTRTKGITYPTLHVQPNLRAGLNTAARLLLLKNSAHPEHRGITTTGFVSVGREYGNLYLSPTDEPGDDTLSFDKEGRVRSRTFAAQLGLAFPGLEFPATFRIRHDDPKMADGRMWYRLERVPTADGSRKKT